MATKTYLIFKIKATDYVCIWHHLLLFFYPVKSPNLSCWEIEDATNLCGGSTWSWGQGCWL